MSIPAGENEIIGGLILVNGRLVADEQSCRIRELTKTSLECLATSEDGWERLYRAPDDGRYWELFYPHSEMHGGGPPGLRVIPRATAVRKYRLGD